MDDGPSLHKWNWPDTSGNTRRILRTALREERIEFPSRRGNRLVGLFAAGTGPLVLLCHGMESTKEGTKHGLLAERFAALGIGTLRFDFSYVGESEGEFADLSFRGEVEDLGGAWDHVRSVGADPVGIIGSSMGGAVALLFAAGEPRVAAVATIAAVGRPARIIEEIRPDERERWRKDGAFSLGGIRLRSSFLDDVESLDVVGACREIRCPTFVGHGDADRVVPCDEGREIAEALGERGRLKIYPGADHRFSNAAHLEELLGDLVDWIARHLDRSAA